jgi:hypothetical protein
MFGGSGCGRDSDVVIIDFSKKVAIEQPGVILSEDETLKVAVAAMISPKETVAY